MVSYRKPVERSENIIDRRNRGSAVAVRGEERARLQRIADENMKAALRLRRMRARKN